MQTKNIHEMNDTELLEYRDFVEGRMDEAKDRFEFHRLSYLLDSINDRLEKINLNPKLYKFETKYNNTSVVIENENANNN